jgi:hypothetical protein
MGKHPARFEKRRKELERVESRKEKAERRAKRREAGDSRPAGGDPDIDWIVPGPQPPVRESGEGAAAATRAQDDAHDELQDRQSEPTDD